MEPKEGQKAIFANDTKKHKAAGASGTDESDNLQKESLHFGKVRSINEGGISLSVLKKIYLAE